MVECPKDVIVPVIFLPGIMGSRLKAGGEKVWDPEDSLFMARTYGANAGTVMGFDNIFRAREKNNVRAAAAKRKKLLIGGDVFDIGHLAPYEFAKTKNITDDQAKRNWGSVSWSSYGTFLQRLEGMRVEIQSKVQEINPEFNLKEMPVYALGYNWSASNDDSGKYAAGKIENWVSEARSRATEIGAQCPGAIIVTHSMGGLVARAASQIHGAASDIFAVIHTVMPLDGAAAAYKRFHFGFENPDGGGVVGHVGYLALGRQGALVTAVLGHMPGGQELLPNKRYRDNAGSSKWLSLKNPDRNIIGKTVDWITGAEEIHLPNSNPYTEIYQQENMMYRAANPEWLFPEGTSAIPDGKSMFDFFANVNKIAERYHDKVIGAGDFHEVTYLAYSDDPSYKTYDRIDWQSEKWLGEYGRKVTDKNLEPYDSDDYRRENLSWGDEADKKIDGRFLGSDFKIALANGSGDSTVPASAGKFASLPRSRKMGHTSGYEHEPALKSNTLISWIRDTMIETLGECTLY